MARQQHWERPEVRGAYNEVDKGTIRDLLKNHELEHLSVSSRGNHLVIYSEEEGIKYSRVRFSRIGVKKYELGIYHHTGRWESTYLTGTIPELFSIVAEQFPWLLQDF